MLGEGIIKGMGETARNFFGSYVKEERLTTVQYPEERLPQKEAARKSKDRKPDYIGKPQFYPAVFDIDTSVCMSCQICVEVCPFEAIKMDTEFELSTTDRFDGLQFRKSDLAKSNDYYHSIHPTEASDVDGRLAAEKAKAEAKAKADAEAKAKAAAAPKPASSPTSAPVPALAK